MPEVDLLSDAAPADRATVISGAVAVLEHAYSRAERTGAVLSTAAAHAATTAEDELQAARTAHVTALHDLALAAHEGAFHLAHLQPGLADVLVRAAASYCDEADQHNGGRGGRDDGRGWVRTAAEVRA